MEITITKLYALINEKLGSETAESLTTFIENKVKAEVQIESKNLATKDDLHQVKFDIIKWMVSLFITLSIMIIGLYFKN